MDILTEKFGYDNVDTAVRYTSAKAKIPIYDVLKILESRLRPHTQLQIKLADTKIIVSNFNNDEIDDLKKIGGIQTKSVIELPFRNRQLLQHYVITGEADPAAKFPQTSSIFNEAKWRNTFLMKILGYSPNKLTGQQILDTIPIPHVYYFDKYNDVICLFDPKETYWPMQAYTMIKVDPQVIQREIERRGIYVSEFGKAPKNFWVVGNKSEISRWFSILDGKYLGPQVKKFIARKDGGYYVYILDLRPQYFTS
jgi:hypothetical protein